MKNLSTFFGAVGPKCGKTYEILHHKRERPVKTQQDFGTVGPKMWQNVGSFASEKAKFCEKSRIHGAMQGPNCGKM